MQPLDNLIHDLGIYLSIKLVFLFRSWHTWHGVTWFQRLAQPSPNQSLNPSHWIDLEMRNSGGLTCKSVQSVPVLWNLSVFSLLSLLTLKFWSLLQTSEPLVIKSTCIFALLGGPKIWNEENRNYGTRSCKADKLDSFFAFCRCLIWKLKHQNWPWSDITWYNDVMWHDMTWYDMRRYAVNQYAVAQLGGHRGSDRSPRGMLANSKGSTRRTTTYTVLNCSSRSSVLNSTSLLQPQHIKRHQATHLWHECIVYQCIADKMTQKYTLLKD